MASNSSSHPSSNDRLLSPTKRSRLSMHPSTDASPDITANEPHLTYEAADKIIKKLSPDMVENILKFISGEEVMRTSDVACILSYLDLKDIMRARRVSKKWRDAAKVTVPTSEFVVASVRSFNTMRLLTNALPNLQQLKLSELGYKQEYIDGENPIEEEDTEEYTAHDINLISNFRKLRSLCIEDAPLNGIYPVLFNFPLLQKLSICNDDISYLEWNLDMLQGLPSLKELVVVQGEFGGGLSGNLRSLRVLKDTLEWVEIKNVPAVKGHFMDLADFPRLKYLDLQYTDVTGDIRDICENDFPALDLESLCLPTSVIGGFGHKFQHVFQVPSFMHAIHRLLQRTPNFFEWELSYAFNWTLSRQSPDWYYYYDRVSGSPEPPFDLQIIQAGSRFGWSWCSRRPCSAQDVRQLCEINWLDPEPSSESNDYEAYMEKMHGIQQHNINFYKGYNKPPNAIEYRRLCEGLRQEIRDPPNI